MSRLAAPVSHTLPVRAKLSSMTSRVLHIDGTPAEVADPIDPDDPAILLGVSAFETLRTHRGVPLLLGQHHERLCISAERLRISPPSLPLLRAEIDNLLDGWPPDVDGNLRVTLTGGGRRILRLKPAPPPHPLLRCVTRPWAPVSGLETAKHGARAGWVVSVQDSGADDVIWVDGEGRLLEASCGAVLARCGGAWVSPPDDGRILPSVSLGLLEALVPIERRPLALDAVEALWLCSSLKWFAPVVSLDGAPLPRAEADEAVLRARLAGWLGSAAGVR